MNFYLLDKMFVSTYLDDIKNIKEKSENLPPFVLGGKIVDVLEEKIHDMIEVDLITKDLEEALRFLKPKNERAIRNRIERAS